MAREVQHLTLQLTRARNGTPISGLPVKSYAHGNRWLLYTTVTDADGFAECNAPLPGPPTLALLLLTGYEGVFTGNAAYLPARATAFVGLC